VYAIGDINSFHFSAFVVLWLNGLDFIFASDCVVEMTLMFDVKKNLR
jgi:hypothetical protein